MSFIPGKTLVAPTSYVAASATLLALGSKTYLVTVPGAIPGSHAVFAGPLTDPGSLIIAQAWVSAAGQVTLRVTNLSAVNTATTAQVTWMIALV